MELEQIYAYCRRPKNPEDFWEINEELSYMSPFNEFSKKKDSAKIMCAIYMIYDPKSQLVNSGEEIGKIKKDVSRNFLGDEDFDWSEYRDIVISYKKLSKSKIEKELDAYYMMIQERRALADDLDWEDDFDQKDKILQTHKAYIDDYIMCAAQLKEERHERLMHGDYTPSRLEARIL